MTIFKLYKSIPEHWTEFTPFVKLQKQEIAHEQRTINAKSHRRLVGR